MSELGGKPLFIRHYDQLKNYNPEYHTCIIFDDYSISSLDREAKIHLFDINNDSRINVKYGVVTLLAGIDKIFSTTPLDDFDLSIKKIAQRVVVVNIKEPLFNNLIENENTLGSNPLFLGP
jgi:myosin-crossreactive antigen